MFLYVYLFIFVLGFISSPVLTASEGEKCNNSEDWSCVRIEDCTMLYSGRKVWRVQYCEKNNGVPIICCQTMFPKTPKQPTTTQKALTSPVTSSSKSSAKPSISSQMCQNYSSYVWELRESRFNPNVKVYNCPNRISNYVVGGEPAKLGEFPHMAVLGYGKEPGNWQCGGSLISDKFVLTAAHCIEHKGGRVQWVRLGELDYSRTSDGADPIDVKVLRSYIHPKYDTNYGLDHDIALLELESSVKLNRKICPICLIASSRALGRKAKFVVWGNTQNTPLRDDSKNEQSQSSRLMTFSFPLTRTNECVSTYKRGLGINLNPDIHICAGNNWRVSCKGDLGGPLQIIEGDSPCMYMVIGVFGKDCGNGYPGVFTRVSHYVPWIESIVWPQP